MLSRKVARIIWLLLLINAAAGCKSLATPRLPSEEILSTATAPEIKSTTTIGKTTLEASIGQLPTTTIPPIITETPIPTPFSPTLALPSPEVGPTSPPSSLPLFISISMIDHRVGWGLNDYQVLRTEDGGQSWRDISPPTDFDSPLGGFFLDANHGWVLVPNAQDLSTGVLFRTADGGKTWLQADTPFGSGQMQFLNATLGWNLDSTDCGAGSCDIKLFETTDGGNSWLLIYQISPIGEEKSNDLPRAGTKNGISFRDPDHAWVGGVEPRPGYVWLFASQDGGRTWLHQDLALPAGFENSIVSVDPPRFFSQREGVLPVTFFTDVVWKVFFQTQDGGQTWTSTQPVQNNGVYDLISLSHIWVWDGETLVKSQDGGLSWTTLTPNINLKDILIQLDFVDKNVGWAITMDANGNSALFKTSDGGETWAQQ